MATPDRSHLRATHACLHACSRTAATCSISARSRHRRRHVHCRGYGRAGTQNERLGEAVSLSTGTPIPAQWTCRRRCRYVVMATPDRSHLRATHACLHACSRTAATFFFRLDLGIADGMSIAAGRGVPVPNPGERRSFRVLARPYLRNGHAVGDAEIEPIWRRAW